MSDGRVGRRTFLRGGMGVVALGGLGATGYELVDHGVLPGRSGLDRTLGRTPSHDRGAHGGGLGPAVSGTFHSAARGMTVGWTISYPPGRLEGDRLPLVLALHGYTGSHVLPLGPVPPVQLLAARYHDRPLPAMAIAAIDGGNEYWHAHPGDNPMRMLLDEFLPMCRQRSLGLGRHRKIGLAGVSMGGYGSFLLAEEHPDMVAAIAAISPAVWTTYDDSQNANPTAFTSATDFADHDIITHAPALRGIPVRIASGTEDPFHPYVEALAPVLPHGSRVLFPPGGHVAAFFESQAVPSLAFIGRHLSDETAA